MYWKCQLVVKDAWTLCCENGSDHFWRNTDSMLKCHRIKDLISYWNGTKSLGPQIVTVVTWNQYEKGVRNLQWNHRCTFEVSSQKYCDRIWWQVLHKHVFGKTARYIWCGDFKTDSINVEITSFLSIHNINDYYDKGCFETSIFCAKPLQRP